MRPPCQTDPIVVRVAATATLTVARDASADKLAALVHEKSYIQTLGNLLYKEDPELIMAGLEATLTAVQVLV